MRGTQYVIAHEGMGGAFNPPGHAEHSFSVHEMRNGREVGSSSLSYALSQEHLPQHIKDRAKALLAEHPGAYTPEWEQEVYAYFRNCYSPDGVDRNISACVVIRGATDHPERHLAYLHVKSFFPEAQPRLDLIGE